MNWAAILAVIAGILFFLDAVLWHTVASYKSRTLVGVAGVVLSVAVLLMSVQS